jgi:multiple sugar transport system permease protein
MKPMVWTALKYVLLFLGAVIMATPFVYMLSTSLKGPVYTFEYPPRLIPKEPTLSNFVEAWSTQNFGLYFRNSLIVAITATLLSALLSAMLAYAFARFDFKGKEFFFYVLLVALMIPGMTLLIPQFLLAKTLGLRNSLWGLILMYVTNNLSLNTFLLRGFFEQLPRDLEESVLIDGGWYFTIFFRIILPLSKPALATVSIFTFLFCWDEYIWATVAIDEVSKRTLPVAIATFYTAHRTQWGLIFAASLIAFTPVLITYIALQKYFIKGLTAGAFK